MDLDAIRNRARVGCDVRDLARDCADLLTALELALARVAALEQQVDEYHEWVEAAMWVLPDWMAPAGHAGVHAALAPAAGEEG